MKPDSPHPSIVVGYDGSDESRDAVALGQALAPLLRSRLVLTWIEPVGPLDVPYDVVFKPIQARAEDALAAVAQNLREHGLAVDTRVGLLGSAAQGIHELAQDASADLIVIGSSHRGRIGRVLAGTVGTQLLHRSTCPVAIAPRGLADAGVWRPGVIGIAYDSSPEARAALETAGRLARTAKATLQVIAVADAPGAAHEVIDSAASRLASQREAQGWLHEASHAMRRDFTVATRLALGEPAAELLKLSDSLDLLVLGSRGHGRLRRALLGSVSSYLAEHARCPLIVTPTPREALDGSEAASAVGDSAV